MKNDRSNPFRIDVAPELLSELRERLKNTRWSYRVGGTNWDAGTDLNYLRELVAYWLDGYDWRSDAPSTLPCPWLFSVLGTNRQ